MGPRTKLELTVCRWLGGLSIASGVALACAPLPLARAYALPRRRGLMRALGLRDVCVGLMLLSPRSAAGGCTLRCVSDATDLVLISTELSRTHRGGIASALRIAGAVGLIALSAGLGGRLRRVAESTRC